MYKRILILALTLFLAHPVMAQETVKGKLDYLSIPGEIVEVEGKVYHVNTETTRIIYQGERVGEEDLRPGDDVILYLERKGKNQKKRELKAIILVRGSKTGLES